MPEVVTNSYDALFERCGVEPEMRTPENFFFDKAPDGSLWPIPRQVNYEDKLYTMTEMGSLIDPRARISSQVYIGARSIIKDAVIHSDARIEDGVFINNDAYIYGKVNVRKEATIGLGALLRYGVEVGSYATIGDNVSVHDRATIGYYSTLDDGVFLGTESSLGSRVAVGSSTHISSGVKVAKDVVIGRSCNIGEKAVIGEGSYLADMVFLNNRRKIKPSTYVAPSIQRRVRRGD